MTNKRTTMYGFEKLTSMCGLGCKVFWNPFVQAEKTPYDAVLKEDVTDSQDQTIVTSEPHKPDWGEIPNRAPIVRNKTSSVTNVSRSGASYEKLPVKESLPKLNDKRLSRVDLTGSKSSLAGSKSSLTGSKSSLAGSKSSLTGSDQKLEVTELVTTV